MRNVYDCDYDDDCYIPTPDELSTEDYLDSLKNCFPQVFMGLLETPRQFIKASENLILTWEMWYGNRIRDEIYTASEETRQVAYIVYVTQVCRIKFIKIQIRQSAVQHPA